MNHKKKQGVTLTHSFDHVLHHDEYGAAILELVKHLMFARYQIPLPVQCLQNECAAEAQYWSEAEARVKTQRNTLYKQWSKKREFVDEFKALRDCLLQLVQRIAIRKVVILLGSTIMSPKEVVVVDTSDVQLQVDAEKENIPRHISERKISTTCRQLMQKVITSSALDALSEIPAYNISVLVNTASKCNSALLIPRVNYNVPSRGIRHTVLLSTGGEKPDCNEPNRINIEFEPKISNGSESFSEKSCNGSDSQGSKQSFCPKQKPLDKINLDVDEIASSLESCSVSEEHWYQIKCNLKGYKESQRQDGSDWI